MYKLTDLFDKRSVVGAKLEQILVEKSYTKSWLCKKSRVSRPTLDKLLAGTITNKTNYEKHIDKILNCLDITPDILMGNITNRYIRAREVRKIMKISSEEISNAIGITQERLKKIELGEKASVAELQDIAMCLHMGINDLLGLNYFEPQIATLDYFLLSSNSSVEEKVSGFWGHVGILPNNMENYLWFPITGNTKGLIYQIMNNEQMVIPCMNNKVLFLNMKNIKNIILLDEACDPPEFSNWDPSVSCGEIPMVVFETIENYFYFTDSEGNQDTYSSRFQNYLDKIVEAKGWTEDTIYEITELSTIYYADGKKGYTTINFDRDESISSKISAIYEFGESVGEDNILYFEDLNGAEKLLNMRNISMLEFPLIKVEKAIRKLFEDIEL